MPTKRTNQRLADEAVRFRTRLMVAEASAVRGVTKPLSTLLDEIMRSMRLGHLTLDQARGFLARIGREGSLQEAVALAREDMLTKAGGWSANQALVDLQGLISGQAIRPAKASMLSVYVRQVAATGLPYATANVAGWIAAGDGVFAAAIEGGWSVPNTVRALEETVGSSVGTGYNFERLVRTELQQAASDMALAVYRENSDIVRGRQYLATLDTRTCEVCAPYHEQVFALGNMDGPPVPQHPNCRCFYAPITATLSGRAGEEQARQLAAESMGYPDWLSRQSEEDQIQVLGAERAQRWIAGGFAGDPWNA